MRSFLNSICIVLLAGSLAAAQTTPAKSTSAKPAEKRCRLGIWQSSLRSHGRFVSASQFGYEKDLTWKISSIKPSPIPGLAEVTVVLASPQGQQLTRFFVSPDGKQALVGEIIPFGAHAV